MLLAWLYNNSSGFRRRCVPVPWSSQNARRAIGGIEGRHAASRFRTGPRSGCLRQRALASNPPLKGRKEGYPGANRMLPRIPFAPTGPRRADRCHRYAAAQRSSLRQLVGVTSTGKQDRLSAVIIDAGATAHGSLGDLSGTRGHDRRL